MAKRSSFLAGVICTQSAGIFSVWLNGMAGTERRRTLLDDLVHEHIEQHDDAPDKSLEAMRSKGSIDLEETSDFVPEVQSTLSAAAHRVAAGHAPFRSGETESRGLAGGRFRVNDLHEEGGLGRACEVFGDEIGDILEQLNTELAAA